MENDYLVNIYKIYYTNQHSATRKFRKLMTSWDCLQTTFFPSKNGNNYYISMILFCKRHQIVETLIKNLSYSLILSVN